MKNLAEVLDVAKIDVADVFVTLLLASILIPIAMNQFSSVDTTTWSTMAKTIWDNLPVIGLTGILIGFIAKSGIASKYFRR